MILKFPSNPNDSVILWSLLSGGDSRTSVWSPIDFSHYGQEQLVSRDDLDSESWPSMEDLLIFS